MVTPEVAACRAEGIDGFVIIQKGGFPMPDLANVLRREYLSIRVWQEDGVFVAKCLDLSGCISEGATRDEAITNIDDAIRGCLEVIREDSRGPSKAAENSVEIIERPIDEFIGA